MPLLKGQIQRVVFRESSPATLAGGTNDVYGHGTHKENPTFFTSQSFYINKGKSAASLDYKPLSGTSMATGVASGAG